MKVDFRPARYEFRPVRAGRGGFMYDWSDFRYERSDFGLVTADFRPERAASMIKRLHFRPQWAGLKPESVSTRVSLSQSQSRLISTCNMAVMEKKI